VSTRFDSRIGSRTKSNMFDSSDRLSDQSDEAFTRYDRRTDDRRIVGAVHTRRFVDDKIVPTTRLDMSAGQKLLSATCREEQSALTVAAFSI